MLLYTLDLVGVFAFASFGAFLGIQKRYNAVGIFFCAALPALGGGTMRELLLGGTPVYFHDTSYLLVVMFAAVVTWYARSKFYRLQPILLILDAIGLSVFAYVGAARAQQAGFGAEVIILCALLTAVGGGLIAEAISGVRPHIFKRRSFYIEPALALALLYIFFGNPHSTREVAFLIATAFLLRVVYVFRKQILRLAKKSDNSRMWKNNPKVFASRTSPEAAE